jgi:hypothetical protein
MIKKYTIQDLLRPFQEKISDVEDINGMISDYTYIREKKTGYAAGAQMIQIIVSE